MNEYIDGIIWAWENRPEEVILLAILVGVLAWLVLT